MIFKIQQLNLRALMFQLVFIQNVDAKSNRQYSCEMQNASTFHPNYNAYAPPTMASLMRTQNHTIHAITTKQQRNSWYLKTNHWVWLLLVTSKQSRRISKASSEQWNTHTHTHTHKHEIEEGTHSEVKDH